MRKIKVFGGIPGSGKSASMLLHALSSNDKRAFVLTEVNALFLFKRIRNICNNMQINIPIITEFFVFEKSEYDDVALLIQSGYKEIYIDTMFYKKYSTEEIKSLLYLCDVHDCTIYASSAINRFKTNIISCVEVDYGNDYFELYAHVEKNDSEIITNYYNKKQITTPLSIFKNNEQ